MLILADLAGSGGELRSGRVGLGLFGEEQGFLFECVS